MADIATKADKYDKLMEDLRDLVKCPVCMSIPEKGPIASCPNGHLVCQPCQQEIEQVKGRLSHCPTCRGPMGKNLNLTAKMLIEKMEHLCPNEGCNEILSHQELSKHKEQLCNFREIPSNTFTDQARAEDIEHESVSNSNDQILAENQPQSTSESQYNQELYIGLVESSSASIDSKIDMAMDMVKNHLMMVAKKKVDELKDKIDDLTNSLQTLSTLNNNLKDTVQVLFSENNNLKDRVSSLTIENKNIKDKVKALSSENARLRNHVDPKVLSQMPIPAQASGQAQVQAQGDLGSDALAVGLTPDDQDHPAPQPPQL